MSRNLKDLVNLIEDIRDKIISTQDRKIILIHRNDLRDLQYFLKNHGLGFNAKDLGFNDDRTIMGIPYRIAEVEEVEVY